jgi:single-stranded DNA-specific DHH superfamily exonuclease
MIKPTLCVHHHPCADGWTAAWAVWKAFGDSVKFHPGVHGQPPPDVTGEHVVIVDFSYSKDVLFEMCKTTASILVLDHHLTAQKDLADFPPPCGTWEAHIEDALRYERAHGLNRIGVQFDMNRSGAMMDWNYFDGPNAPKLVQHVRDRDLWKFRLIGTREIQSWVFSHPYDFAVRDELAETLQREDGWRSAFDQGKALDRKMQKDIAELIGQTRRDMVIGGHRVPVVNLPYTMASEAAGKLAEDSPFAAAYFDHADGKRVFSLRSRGDFDVGALAKQVRASLGFSGGGHAQAAGFRAPLGWEGEAE